MWTLIHLIIADIQIAKFVEEVSGCVRLLAWWTVNDNDWQQELAEKFKGMVSFVKNAERQLSQQTDDTKAKIDTGKKKKKNYKNDFEAWPQQHSHSIHEGIQAMNTIFIVLSSFLASSPTTKRPDRINTKVVLNCCL